MNKRKITVASIYIAALFVTAGTAIAASNLKSVSQKAAEASPPSPSEITVVVVKRQLLDTVDLTCSAGFRGEEFISGPDTLPSVLTAAPLQEGQPVGDGTLLTEINGSPLFAIVGAFPLYRELKLDDSGPDVRLVNDAMVRAGVLRPRPEPAASTVTSSTAAAIAALYVKAGYPAPKTDMVVVSPSEFQVLSASGTVSGPVHGPGPLDSQPIATVGIGPRGFLCAAGDVPVPAEAKDGQSVRIPKLDTELHPMMIIPRKPGIGTTGNSSTKAPPSTDETSPSGPAGSEADERVLFVEAEDAAEQLGNVAGTLILATSGADPLVVPSSALWTKDGQTLVTVKEDDASVRDVPVVVEFSAAGDNAVRPADPGIPLTAGDRVKVTGAR
jgi:hypothetical protein